MPRLSSPIENIKDHYTAIVIGSGYGGGIAASRLARAGQSVCVLERGKEFQPGEYPDTNIEFLKEVQVHLPNGERIGSQTGLYDFRMNQELNALVGCGLGGTSLINANVALRPEPRVFEDPCWPVELQHDLHTTLEDGYRHAEEMLKPTPYPENFPKLPKLLAHQKSTTAFGADKFARLPINVTFTEGINHVGVKQNPCNLCGDCMSGCNQSAKNTVLMNYLPDAKNHGAEIYTQTGVRYLERKDGHWLVHYQILGEGREFFKAPTAFVSADIVILAAGTFGSTEILLRSKMAGLSLSEKVGQRFSGNGDVLGFAYNNDVPVNMLGFGGPIPEKDYVVGPTITSVIDLRNQPDWKDGMVIEEGAVAGALAGFLPGVMAKAAKRFGVDTDRSLPDLIAEKARELESIVRGPYTGAVKNTQVYLVMSHDDNSGTLFLDDHDELRVSWPGAGEESFVKSVNEKLEKATRPLGGTFILNPAWSRLQTHPLVSAHPLGGCAMADDADRGVVNHKGQVFSGPTGKDVYEGLYVNDGAVIPRSLGCNPHITISAIAERNCALMAKDRGWQLDYSFTLPEVVAEEEPQRLGIKFTEAMDGFFSTQVKDDFEAGARLGQAEGSMMRFIVTIESNDVEEMISSPQHKGRLIGTVIAPALSPEAMVATDGEFYLFITDPDVPDTKLMWYQMKMTTEEGKQYFLDGRKRIHDDIQFDLWADTTTLFVTVYEGTSNQGPVVGKGILRIKPEDLQQQMRTMQVTNAMDKTERLSTLSRFSRFFSGQLADTYSGVVTHPNLFNPDAPPRKKRPLRVGVPEVYFFQPEENVRLRLTRYQGGKKGPVLLAHGLGVSSLAFSTDLIDTNLLEYLYAYGYDVWLLDYRSSIELPYATTQYTADDVALVDWPAAVKKVLEVTEAETIQVVAHCYGAITFNMAMLAGLQGVRSAVCSQVGSHLSVIPSTRIKSGLHLDAFLKGLGIESLTMYTDTQDAWYEQLYNTALNVYPVTWKELCNSPVCHRITFLYAPLYEHLQLNDLTHDNLHELFGVASISNFEHLSVMTRAGQIVNAKGEDVYVPHMERMNIPIAFIHGAENETWVPASTRRTYDLLREKNPNQRYSRYLIPHYGHIDCIFGKNASRDVYPLILKHLEVTQNI
jgi:cholesterol oxidase